MFFAFMWRIEEKAKGSVSSSCRPQRCEGKPFNPSQREDKEISRKAQRAVKTSRSELHMEAFSWTRPPGILPGGRVHWRIWKENSVTLTCTIFAGMWVTPGADKRGWGATEWLKKQNGGRESESERVCCVCVCDFNEYLLKSGQKKLWSVVLSYDFL